MIKTAIKTGIYLCCYYVVGYIAAFLAMLGLTKLFKHIWPDLFQV